MQPVLSEHFQERLPSAIRLTQIAFAKRMEPIAAVNVAIGNVSLPMHPAMTKRMFSMDAPDSPFRQGVVKYSTTVGEEEATKAFLHIIASSGFSTNGLYCQITDGGSQAIELAILGVCGPAGSGKNPLLVLDPTYPNYISMAKRTGRPIVPVSRLLQDNGEFTLPSLEEIERVIQETKPGALLVIPYDNPTGQFFPQKILNALGQLCVKYNLWMISDEAYREIFFTEDQASSVWNITERAVPGIEGRRISIESASKIWNGCGLRIGALVTDNRDFHERSVAENTANLCSNAIGQYIFGALLYESKEELHAWFKKQCDYYLEISRALLYGLKKEMPELIISTPNASLYTVVDIRNLSGSNIDTTDFAMYCAQKGKVHLNGVDKTLLISPMTDWYSPGLGKPNLGKSQIRIAYVESPARMAEVPSLLAQLLRDYTQTFST